MNDKKLTFAQIGKKMKILATFTLKLEEGGEWLILRDGIQDDEAKKGVTAQAIRDWIAGKTKSANLSKVREIVDVLNNHLKLKQLFSDEDFSDDTDDATFLEKLQGVGFSTRQAYIAAGQSWANDHVIGTFFSLNNKGAPAEVERLYSGLYTIRRRQTENGESPEGSLIRLAVSYAIPVARQGRSTRSFLFCKLAVPGEKKEPYRYRGYFSTELSILTWIFFEETELQPDMLVFMTNTANFKMKKEKGWTATGKMLTASAKPYKPTSYDLELNWVGDFADPEQIEKFLRDGVFE